MIFTNQNSLKVKENKIENQMFILQLEQLLSIQLRTIRASNTLTATLLIAKFKNIHPPNYH